VDGRAASLPVATRRSTHDGLASRRRGLLLAGLIRYRPDQRGIGPLAPLQPLLSWKERRLDDFAERVEIAAAG
jgi:hypothetical protein